MVMNVDRDNKKGTHWWSLLESYTCRFVFCLIALVLLALKNL